MNSNKILALIPALILSTLLILAFSGIDADVTDPWYAAIQEVQKGQKMAKDNPEEAMKLINSGGEKLKELTEIHPYHARVHFLLSYYYLTVQDFENSYNSALKAIELGKGGIVNQVEFEAENIAVKAAANMFNKLKGRILLDKIWEVRNDLPRNQDILLYGANAHIQVQQLDSAMFWYEQVLRINKNNKTAQDNYAKLTFFYGNNLIKENNFQGAYHFYRLAQQTKPNNPDYNNNLGNAALKLNKLNEAKKYFERAAQLDPKNEIYKGNLKIVNQRLARGTS